MPSGPTIEAWPNLHLLHRASHGAAITLAEVSADALVLYFYPGSEVSPEDGRESPERDRAQHLAFVTLGVAVFGISTPTDEQQAREAQAERIHHLLLSDPDLTFAEPLKLRTFSIGSDASFYARSLVVLPRSGVPVRLEVGCASECVATALARLKERVL